MPTPIQPRINMATLGRTQFPYPAPAKGNARRAITGKETPGHGLTQQKVLDALGNPTMTWSYMWGLRSVREIYNTFWAWDARLRTTGGVTRAIWKSERYVLGHLQDLKVEFGVPSDDDVRHNWKLEYHLVAAVKSLINDCSTDFPVFSGHKYTSAKVRAAINLLRKIHATCKGKDMVEVRVPFKGRKLVIPAHLKLVTPRTVVQWCNAWMEGDKEQGVMTGVYEAGIGLVRDRGLLTGDVVDLEDGDEMDWEGETEVDSAFDEGMSEKDSYLGFSSGGVDSGVDGEGMLEG